MTTIPSIRPRRSLGYRISLTMKRDWQLWVLLIPALAFFIVFCYFPMYGAQIAFRNYKAAFGITGSKWVGWDNFEKFFKLYYCGRMFKNTNAASFRAAALRSVSITPGRIVFTVIPKGAFSMAAVLARFMRAAFVDP